MSDPVDGVLKVFEQYRGRETQRSDELLSTTKRQPNAPEANEPADAEAHDADPRDSG